MYKVIMCATLSESEAETIADLILENDLAACIQILEIKSRYKWKGRKEKADEHLLLIKTKAEKYEEIENLIKANHSYKIPEIIALPVSDIYSPYAAWINESVK